MKKGIWIRNLASQILRGNISPVEGLAFGLARIKPKPVSFSLKSIRFDEVDHIFWSVLADVFINRVYFPKNFMIRPHDIVIDIGAHRGGFTSFAATNALVRVIAFEPHPDNFRLLKRLIANNQLNNVSAFNIAIGATTGKSRLFLSSASSRHNLLGHEIGTTKELSESIETDVLSLNDSLKDLEKIDFLKLDCEGAEIEILLNASDATMSKIEKLVAEVHDPVDSPIIKQLCERLSRSFPHIKLVPQSNKQYGYLYAHR